MSDYPTDWRVSSLGEIATIKASNVDKKSKAGHREVLLCNYMDVFKNPTISSSLAFMKSTASEKETSEFSLSKGDVLLTKDSEVPEEIGIPSVVCDDIPNLVCGYHLYILRSDHNLIYPGYLCWALRSSSSRQYFYQKANGSTRFGLNLKHVEECPFPIPPLPEQKKIAEILSGIDTLLKVKETKIKKTRLLLKQAIEDSTRRSATGETVPLKELGEWKGGGTPSKSVSEYWNGEIPWVSPKDMKEQRISTSQDKITEAAIENSTTSLVPRGSVLFVVRSGILRHTLPIALAAKDVTINQDLKALTVNERCNASFLFHYLSCKSDEILASCMKSGTTVESIDTNSLQNYEVPTLSPAMQAQLALFAEGITKTCEGEESQVESLKMLKTALSADLLSGRKRVSV